MAAKGGSAGGAKLATGFIELTVRYASAMGQIASDFDAIDKRSKATGESITKNLVAGADQAKAKVTELGAAYELQRVKVTQLKSTLQSLQAQQESAAAADRALTAARNADAEKRKAHIREEISLNEQMAKISGEVRNSMGGRHANNSAVEAAVKSNAQYQALAQQQVALDAKRKKDLQDLTRLEKELSAARSATGGDTSKVQAVLNAELAKGKEMAVSYGNAVEDVARKQKLAAVSTAALGSSLGSASQHISVGMRMAKLIGGPFAPELYAAGTKAGNAFRSAFGKQMDAARGESSHHARNIASGLFMGMTPGVMGAAGVGLAIGAAFTAGFNRNEILNTTRLRLQALGKTQAEINALTSTAEQSVIGTQYSLAEAMEAATGAMAANIQLGPAMTQHMDNIANAAALSGQSYATVAEAVNRVSRMGTVSLENLEPLLHAGVPILDWLTEYYKKDFPSATLKDITDMISKKMVPADVLEKAMSLHLNNSMKAIGKKTVKGAFTDLFTQIGKVTGAILEPMMGEGGIPAFLNNIGAKLNSFSVYIKPGMYAAVAWIKQTWKDLWPYVQVGIDWLRDTWEKLWPRVKEVFNLFAAHWKTMWPQLREHFQPFMRAMREAWDALFPYIKNIGIAIGAVALYILDHLPAITQFATNVIHWFSVTMDWLRTKFWPWLKDSWKKFSTDVTNAWQDVKTFSDKVIGFFDAIKTGTEKTWTWIEDKFKWMKDNIPGVSALLSALGFSSPQVALTSSSSPMPTGAVSGPPGSYGLPAGANSGGYGGGGTKFPQWVYDFGAKFNIKPSTYPGHQERGGVNHGIDWVGKPEDLQRAADFLANSGAADQVIYANPSSGQKTGYATGYGKVGPGTNQPQYYAADWGDHGNHMHTSFSRSLQTSLTSSSVPMGNTLWDKIAAQESSGRWNDNNSGNNSTSSGAPRGGLQITDGTWKAYGGLEFAPTAAQATKEQQIAVAKRIAFTGWGGTAPQGLSAWEVVTQGKVAGVTGSMSASDFGGIQNLDFSTPMKPGDPGYVGPNTAGGIPIPGLGSSAPNIADILNAASDSQVNTHYSTGSPSGNLTPEELARRRAAGGDPQSGFWSRFQTVLQGLPYDPFGFKEIFKPRHFEILPDTEMPGAAAADALTGAMGMPHSTMQPRFLDSGAGHGGDSQRMHRGIVGPLGTPQGPAGTVSDPIVTTDPQVADNTDPNNQPGAPGGPPVATTPADQPGVGSAVGQGLGTGTDANGNPVDANGNPLGDLTSGLGDVASKAFSDQFAGTPFSDPTQWAGVQSAGALLQFFGGLLRGQGGSGLGGLFGGGGRGKGATPQQQRHMDESMRDKNENVTKAQALVDSMKGKPNFTPEERAEAQDKLNEAIRERDITAADAQDLSVKGVPQNPFSALLPASPPPAPGGDVNGGAVTPGGGWLGNSLPVGALPPMQGAPGQGYPTPWNPAGTNAGPVINNNNTQIVTPEGSAAAADAQRRYTNTTLRPPLLRNNIPPPSGM